MDIMPDGRVRKRFTVNGERYSAYGDTPKEAEENATQKTLEIMQGMYQKNDNITFSAYFKEWIERKAGTSSEKTIFDYCELFRVHIEPLPFSRKKIQKIERREIVGAHAQIAKNKTIATANRVLLLIRSVFKGAVIDEIIVRNPAANIPNLKDKSKRPAYETIHRGLTQEEIAAFMKVAKGTWYYNAIRLMLATGMRIGECSALEWGDIDYKNGFIHIRRTMTLSKEGRYVVGQTTKTEKSRRDIPLNAEICQILRDQRIFYSHFHSEKIQDIYGYIFENSRGGRIVATTINGVIARLAALAGVKRFTVHALRDTFSTTAYINGVPMKTIQEWMGHKDIGTTMNTYTHIPDSEKKKAMENLRVIPV